eukprot:TRINITY_DN42141_c0_g1_i1.p1 TRINITY_DN42141_c0_g1~~TRINITY_DN42141_c0_g1_i1.p1  ORF type:complete len:326 (+),score=-58.89 TRINITY_DN42141_c0_g1_i1:205-1182(+)
MRQAGRYLPEYRALRAKATDFLDFCKQPELACEAALQPWRRFNLDAAIVFSDILTVPEALGMPLHFVLGEGPVFESPIRTSADLSLLKDTEEAVSRLQYVSETTKLLFRALGRAIPIIGFAGSPWTVATYMVEGGSSRTFSTIRTLLYKSPELLHALLDKLTAVTITYLNNQIIAGAEVIMLFDTWGGILAHDAYLSFSLRYMKKIIQHLPKSIPTILFTKQAAPWLESLADTGCSAVGLDATICLASAKARIGHLVALQGNMDPFLLFSSEQNIQNSALQIMDTFGSTPGLIVNLGHGIDKDTPIVSLEKLVTVVQNYQVCREK